MKRRLRAAGPPVLAFVVLAWTLVPLFWMLSASVKTELQLYIRPPRWFVTPVFDSYRQVLFQVPFLQYFANSLIVAVGTTLGAMVLGALAAYGFSRFAFRGAATVRFLILMTRMVPRIALVVPYFLMMLRLGLLDTYTGLILAYVSFALPFTIWLMIGFFDEVPRDIEEAAFVDGCTRFRAFRDVVLPLAAPGLVVTGIFAFLLSWNEFLFALILSGVHSKTLPVVIAGFNTEVGPLYNEMSAAATLVMIPTVILTLALQRHVVRGLTLGAVKG
ncbi:MAG TPA: carbohydrate ABC transporter permease [bacterium]|nr:carbohydrate ABC transporter permease [bacterium]